MHTARGGSQQDCACSARSGDVAAVAAGRPGPAGAAHAGRRSAEGRVPHEGAGRAPCPQRQGGVARQIFVCAPTRALTCASLPHDSATGSITPDTASNRPLHRSLLFSIVHI
jgi:hypothetical protein